MFIKITPLRHEHLENFTKLIFKWTWLYAISVKFGVSFLFKQLAFIYLLFIYIFTGCLDLRCLFIYLFTGCLDLCYLLIYLPAARISVIYLFIYLFPGCLDLRYLFFFFYLLAAQISVAARGFCCCSGSSSLQALKLRLTGLAAPCHMGSELCHQGLNPRPLHWKAGSQWPHHLERPPGPWFSFQFSVMCMDGLMGRRVDT